jgi:cytoskeletal protein CcmA (bactofilin family)
MPDNLPVKIQEKFVKIRQASRILGISIDTIRRWEKKGLLSSQRLDGKDRYFSIAELQNLKNQNWVDIKEAARLFKINKSSLKKIKKSQPVNEQLNSGRPFLIKLKRSYNWEKIFVGGSVLSLLFLILFSFGLIFTKPGQAIKRLAGRYLAGLIKPYLPEENLVLGEEELGDWGEKNLYAISSSTGYISPINAIINSSFESGDSGAAPRHWGYIGQSTIGNTTVSGESVRSGTLAIKLEDRVLGKESGNYSQISLGLSQPQVATVNGRNYLFSLYLRTSDLIGNPVLRMGFTGGNSNDPDQYLDYQLYSSNSDWQRYTLEYFDAVSGKYTYFKILDYQGGKVFVDDVFLNEIGDIGEGGSQIVNGYFPPFFQNNLYLADNTVIADSQSNIYPRIGRQGSLGLPAYPFVSLYLSEASIDNAGKITTNNDLEVKGNSTLRGTVTAHGKLAVDGSFSVGGAASLNTLLLTGLVGSSLIPSGNNIYDLGSSSNYWNNLYATNIYGTITPAGFTQGSVIFVDAGGALTQDNSNFFWDDANNYLGINDNTPSYDLDVNGNGRFTGNLTVDSLLTDGAVYSSSGVLSSEAALDETRGGTGQTTITQGDLLYGSAANTLGKLGIGANGYVLSSNGSIPGWTDPGSLTIRWNTIDDPDGNLTLNHGTYTTTFNTSSTTGTFFTINANSLTSGKGLYLSSTATSLTGNLAEFVLSGSNAANTGNVVRIAQEGTSSAAVPLMVTNLGTGLSFRVNDETGDSDTTPFVIDASGNVGVGTTSPGSKLDVADTAQLRGAAGGTGLYVNSSSNVGIGTTSPQYMLDILATSGGNGIKLKNTSASGWAAYYAYNDQDKSINFGVGGSSAASVANQAYFYATTATPLVLGTNNTTRVHIDSSGNFGIGPNAPTTFFDVSGKFNVTTGGNVGIGTTSPGAKLDVAGNILVNNGGSIDTRSAGTLTIGGTTQTGLTLGRSGAATTISGSTVNISNLTTDGVVYTSGGNGTLNSEALLAITRGGTNSSATPTAGAIAYGTGTAYAFNTAGTSGQPLLSGGSSAPTFGTLGLVYGGTNADLSGVSTGGLIYKDTSALAGTGALSGILQGNGSSAPTAITGTANYLPKWSSTAPYLTSTSLIYDNGTNVGIGTTAPSYNLHVKNGVSYLEGGLKSPYTRTIIVDSGGKGDYTSVSDALNSITNNDSDHRYLVKVMPGTYSGNVTMKTYVDLIGSGIDNTIIEGCIYARANSLVKNLTISLTGSRSWIAALDAMTGSPNANPTYIQDAKVYVNSTSGPVYGLLTGTGSYIYANNVEISFTVTPNSGDISGVLDHNGGSGFYNNMNISAVMSSGTNTKDNISIVRTNWGTTAYLLNSKVSLTNNATSNNEADKIFNNEKNSSTYIYVYNTEITYSSSNHSVNIAYNPSGNFYISGSRINASSAGSTSEVYGLRTSTGGSNTIVNNYFNLSKSSGGQNVYGIYGLTSNITVRNNTFSVSNSGSGGNAYGFYASAASPVFSHNWVSASGTSGSSGYGFYTTNTVCNPSLSYSYLYGSTKDIFIDSGCIVSGFLNTYTSSVVNGTFNTTASDTGGNLYLTGNLGIGATPSYKLDITDASTTRGININNSTADSYGVFSVGTRYGVYGSDGTTSGYLGYNDTYGLYTANDAYVGGSLTLGGNLNITGNILPSADNTYDLGSASLRWKDLYLGPGSLKMYNSYTDASNYELGQLSFASNILTLSSTAAGSGTLRPLQITTGANTGLYMDTSDNVGIGTANPQRKLEVNGSIRMGNLITGGGGAVAVYRDANGDLADATSSIFYKTDIREYEDVLDKIMQLNPVRFKWNEKTATPNLEDFGMIAEEVNLVIPDLVTYNNDGTPRGLKYEKMGVLAIKGIQELASSANRQQEEIDNLKELLKQESIQTLEQKTAVSETTTSEELASRSLVSAISNALKEIGIESSGDLITFAKKSLFNSLVEFIDKVIFRKEVEFAEKVKFNKDTAGIAVIPEFADRVEVKFEKEYEQTPVIIITPLVDEEATGSGYLSEDYRPAVYKPTTKGFTIVLERYAEKDLQFNWSAFFVGEAKKTIGDDSVKRAIEALGKFPEASTDGEATGSGGRNGE